MNLSIIIMIVFFAISVVLSLLAQRKVFRTLNTVFTTISLIMAILSVGLYLDGKHVQEQLAGEKIFLLLSDKTPVAGFIHSGETPTFVNDIATWKQAYGTKAFDTLRDGKLVFTATYETFSKISSIKLGEYTLSKETTFGIINAADSVQAYKDAIRIAANVPEKQQIALPDMNGDEIRGMLFASLISEYFATTQPIQAINRGELGVEPTFIMLWTVKNIPENMLKYLITTEDPDA